MFVLKSGEDYLFPGGSQKCDLFQLHCEQDCLQRAQGSWFYARLPTFAITSATQTLMMGARGSAKGLDESQTRGGQARPRE